MQAQLKLFYFEFVLAKLLDWYKEKFSTTDSNDLSVLKSLKLLFFVTASNSSEKKSVLLDEVFDQFVAMPYGHVETEVYSQLTSGSQPLRYYQIDNKRTKFTEALTAADDLDWSELDSALKAEIEDSIEKLKSINQDLITMSAFDLVELSHAWYSWRFYHSLGKRFGRNSQPIPSDAIKKEDKIFKIQLN